MLLKFRHHIKLHVSGVSKEPGIVDDTLLSDESILGTIVDAVASDKTRIFEYYP